MTQGERVVVESDGNCEVVESRETRLPLRQGTFVGEGSSAGTAVPSENWSGVFRRNPKYRLLLFSCEASLNRARHE